MYQAPWIGLPELGCSEFASGARDPRHRRQPPSLSRGGSTQEMRGVFLGLGFCRHRVGEALDQRLRNSVPPDHMPADEGVGRCDEAVRRRQRLVGHAELGEVAQRIVSRWPVGVNEPAHAGFLQPFGVGRPLETVLRGDVCRASLSASSLFTMATPAPVGPLVPLTWNARLPCVPVSMAQ